jgi:hypothetical protein
MQLKSQPRCRLEQARREHTGDEADLVIAKARALCGFEL